MSRATLTIALVGLLVCAALAQPFVNVSQIPLASYAGKGNAKVPATLWNGWSFTANSTGLIGMNNSARVNLSATDAPFYDALPGVSFIIPMWGNMGFLAIAGGSLAHYNITSNGTLGRIATFTVKNATLDIQFQTGSSLNPSYMYPTWVQSATGSWLLVLGTKNTSVYANNAVKLTSTIFAFNPSDITTPVWQTVVNADSTNFAGSNCSSYVWMLAVNQTNTGGYYTYQLYKFSIANGTQYDMVFDFGTSSFATFRVEGNQWFGSVNSGYLTVGDVNGTIFVNKYSVSGCSYNQFRPFKINTTWYAVCGSYIHMYDVDLKYSSFQATDTIQCGAYHASNGAFIFAADQTIYVSNASGMFLLTSFTSLGSYNTQCTGAQFDYFNYSSPMAQWINNLVHLSFSGYYSGDAGNVLTMDYTTGVVLGQAAGNVNPVGWAISDFAARRLVVASAGTNGAPLQAYEFVPWKNKTSFTTYVPQTSSNTYQLAYNATSNTTYFAASNGYLFTIDQTGVAKQVASFSSFYNTLPMVVIGQWVVVTDYTGDVYIYDSVAASITTVSTCYISSYFAPIAYANNTVLYICDSTYSNDQPAQAVDLKTGAVDKSMILQSSYPPAMGGFVSGDTFVLISDTNMISTYTLGGAKAVFKYYFTLKSTSSYYTSNPISNFLTAPVSVQGTLAYVVAYVRTETGLTASYDNYILAFPISGLTNMTRIAKTVGNTDTSNKVLVFKTGGIYGTGSLDGLLYVIGYNNITAYTMSGNLQFIYKHNYSITTRNVLNPTVLDCGAVAFFDSYNFNVVNGFAGTLAWTYPANSNKYAVIQAVSSIYFSDGNRIVGADAHTGIVNSISTFGSDNTYDYIVKLAPYNTTLVIAATQFHSRTVVFGDQVNQFAPVQAEFAGQGSINGGGNGANGSAASGSKSKAWIAGVVVGLLVVIVVVAVVIKKSGGSESTSDNYVPMTSTQA